MKYGSMGSSNWKSRLEAIRPFAVEESEFYTTGVIANFWDVTGSTSLWDVSLLTGFTSSPNFEIVDEASTFLGSSTIIRAKRAIDISISCYGPMASGGQGVILYKNENSKQVAYQLGDGPDYPNANATVRLEENDFIVLHATNLTQREGLLAIWAKPAINVTLG